MSIELWIAFWASLIIANVYIAGFSDKEFPKGIINIIGFIAWIALAIFIFIIGIGD